MKIGRNIFKDGPSPELEAYWEKLDTLEEEFYSLDPGEQDIFLTKHPEIRDMVICTGCGQKLPRRVNNENFGN